MNLVQTTCLAVVAGLTLSACQSSQSRQAELATICANPVNRQPGQFYFNECQAIDPSSSAQLQKYYRLGAPSAN